MKKSILQNGKTVELAIKEGLLSIGKNKDEVEIEVLQEDSRGVLGIFNKREALVKISYETDIDDSLEELHKEILSESFDSLNKQIEEQIKEEIDNNFKDKEKIEEKNSLEKLKVKEKEDKNLDNNSDKKEDLYNETKENLTENKPEDIDEFLEKENSKDDFSEQLKENYIDKDTSEDILKKDKSSNKQTKEVLKDEKQLNDVEIFYKSRDFLEKMFEYMHLDAKIYGNLDKNHIKFDIKVDYNDTGIAIGKNKQTLDAIEYIVRCAFSERKSPVITIDINNYKKRRDKKLESFADSIAKRTLKTKKRQKLKFMNAYDRRIVHTIVQKYDKLRSYSEGISPSRYVVIEYIEDIN